MITLTLSPHPDLAWLGLATPGAYSEACRQQFLGMPGVRWSKKLESYIGDAAALRIVAATLEVAKVARVKVADQVRPPLVLPDYSLPKRLFPYQRAGAQWLQHQLFSSGAALLADEMGLGKSAQAIAARDALQHRRTLVIAPAIVVPNWRREIEKFGRRSDFAWGAGDSAWWPTSYEKFSRSWKKGELPPFDSAIIDECHYASNPKSGRSKAIAEWRAANPDLPLTLLSGTPMTARVRDLWHPLNLMHPKRWGTWWQFTSRYGDGHYETIKLAEGVEKHVWVADGASNLPELQARLKGVMLRRTKAEVDLQLPPITRTVIEVPLPRSAQRGMLAAAAAQQWSDRSLAKVGVGKILSAVEDYKLDAAEELAQDLIAGGSRPLIFTLRKASAEELGHRLSCPVATGDDRDAAARVAKLDGAAAAVATLDSMTTGINLTQFDCVVFVGLDWLPTKMQQGMMRVHRIGQSRNVTVYFLVGIGTLDEVVRERVIERLDTFAGVTGSNADEMRVAMAGGTDDELLEAMLERIMRS